MLAYRSRYHIKYEAGTVAKAAHAVNEAQVQTGPGKHNQHCHTTATQT